MKIRKGCCKMKWARFGIALLVLFMVSAGGGFGLFYLVSGEEDLPEVEQPQTSRFYYDNGELMTTKFVENRTKVSLEEISEEVLWSTIAAEDRRFFDHFGFDMYGIARAAYQNVREGRITQGGSTITQQLAKNLYLSHDRTWQRKLEEVSLTVNLERHFTKEDILKKYLNTIYYGHATYGIEEAAQLYFDKSADALQLEEAALLAGLPRGPGYYSPFISKDAALHRQKQVLQQMEAEEFITPEEKEAALNEELELNESPSLSRENNYVVDQIINRELLEVTRDNPDFMQEGGLEIYTTIDPHLQATAEEILKEQLPVMRENEKGVTQPQGALVAMEPDTGKIRALVGGKDYGETMLNRVFSRRSPGSAFKPFVYAAALESGLTAADTFYSGPVSLKEEGMDEPYEPTNFDGGFFNEDLSLREALTVSCNVTAVKLNQEIGGHHTQRLAQRLGIESPLGNHLSLPLGSSEVTLMEITAAYAAFANGGYRLEPLLLEEARGPGDEILWENTSQKDRVLDEKVAYLVTDMLQEVVEPGGTASVVSSTLDRPVAGKTGTSQNYKNAYMVGYTPQLVVGLYIGDDQENPLYESGGSLAAPLWAEFMKEATWEEPPLDFNQPSNLLKKTLCPETHLLQSIDCTAEGFTELFVEGTVPEKTCCEADCPECETLPWWHWESWW